jgi:hypothetical protein
MALDVDEIVLREAGIAKMREAIRNSDYLKEAPDCINNGLLYDKTIEGRAYWEEVIHRLQNYRNVFRGVELSFPDLVLSKPSKSTVVPTSLTGPIHVYIDGEAGCKDAILRNKRPHEWPAGHSLVYLKDYKKATCSGCVEAAEKRTNEEALKKKP